MYCTPLTQRFLISFPKPQDLESKFYYNLAAYLNKLISTCNQANDGASSGSIDQASARRQRSTRASSTSKPHAPIQPIWIPIIRTRTVDYITTKCRHSFSLHAILGMSCDDFEVIMDKLCRRKRGFEHIFRTAVHKISINNIAMHFSELHACIEDIQVHIRSYGPSRLQWLLFSFETSPVISSPDREEQRTEPIKWLKEHVSQINTGIEVSTIRGLNYNERLEFMFERKLLREQEQLMHALFGGDSDDDDNNHQPSQKRDRKVKWELHKYGSGETFKVPSTRYPVTKKYLQQLESGQLKKGEVSVSKARLEYLEKLKDETMNYLSGHGVPTKYTKVINGLNLKVMNLMQENTSLTKAQNDAVSKVENFKRKYEKAQVTITKFEHENQAMKEKMSSLENEMNEVIRIDPNYKTTILVGKKLLEMKKKKRYDGNLDSKSLYMLATSTCPQASPEAISMMAPPIIGALFADLDLQDHFEYEEIANNTPSAATIRNVIDIHRQLQMQVIADLVIQDVPIFASFDKGHRNGKDYMVKELSWWDESEKRVETIRLQSDGAGSTSEEAARSWDVALQEIDFWVQQREPGRENVKLYGQTTDSGGGGVLHSVKGELSKLDRIKLEGYVVAACALHVANRALETAVVKSFGECNMNTFNFHHYLFTYYTAQEYLGENFESVWEEATGEKFYDKNNLLQKPVLTRWWSVIRCADQVILSHEEWKKFRDYVFHVFGSTNKDVQKKITALGKVARQNVEVGKCEKIMADLYFFAAFGEEYFKKHMDWLHKIDPISKTFGASSHNMPLRSLIMEWELDDLMKDDSWMEKEKFHKAVEMMNNLPNDKYSDDDGSLLEAGKETTLKQWKLFFSNYKIILGKHMISWRDQSKLHFALASSDKEVASIFAAKLKSINYIPPNNIIQSPVHKCKVDLQRWKKYLDEQDPTNTISTTRFLQNHDQAILKLAMGSSLWSDNDPSITLMKKDCCMLILPLKHQQHSAEAAVRDIGICSETGRCDHQASAIQAFRSLVQSKANFKRREEMQNEDWKPSPNKHRDKNGNPLTAQAQKIDQRNNSEKQLRVRNNKKLAGI